MGLKDLFKKHTVVTHSAETKTATTVGKTEKSEKTETIGNQPKKPFEEVAPKEAGILDMVIAFDTTGSMAAYIDAVRMEVAELIPRLFKDNENLRLGIVAFGGGNDTNRNSGNLFWISGF